MNITKCIKFVLFLFAFYISYGTYTVIAQLNVASAQQIEQFYKTTTCVVKDGKPFSFFNVYLKDALEKNWKLTKLKFIEVDEFEKLRQNTEYSFILLSEATFKEGKDIVKLDILNIVLGQKGNGLDDMPDLGSIPLCYTEDDETVYLYKIPALIKMIQYQMDIAFNNKITSPQSLINHHNQYRKEIRSKELWLLYEELTDEVNSGDKLKKAGIINVKIKSKDELEEAIEKGSDILFIHAISPNKENTNGKMWLIVISAKEGKVFFVKEKNLKNNDENGLGLKDIQDLVN